MFKDKIHNALHFKNQEKLYLSVEPPNDDEIEYIKDHAPRGLGFDLLIQPTINYDYYLSERYGKYLGTSIIEESYGDFFHSEIGTTIMTYAEDRGYEEVSAYMTGRTASDAVERRITFGAFSWIAALNGLSWSEPADIDIYVSEELFEKIKKTHTGKDIPCRSADIKLYEVVEKAKDTEVKIQVHCATHSDLDPLQSASLLAPTELHATGIAFQGANLAAVDPFGALKKGPHEQSFPEHLFDSRNKLAKGSVRATTGALIYLFSTPLPQAPSDKEKVSKEITRVLTMAEDTQIESILEKVTKWSERVPYDDFPAYDTDNQRTNLLFDLGFLPGLITRALEMYDRSQSKTAYEAIDRMLYQLVCAKAAHSPRPEHLQLPDEDSYNQFSEEKIVDLAREIVKNT